MSSVCEYRLAGHLYNGTLSTTRYGRTCQRWDAQFPHSHPYSSESYFSEPTLDEVANYCREPSGLHYILQRPWCYTLDPNQTWEFCDVPEVECYNGGSFNEASCTCDCDTSRYGGDSCEIGTCAVGKIDGSQTVCLAANLLFIFLSFLAV